MRGSHIHFIINRLFGLIHLSAASQRREWLKPTRSTRNRPRRAATGR